MAPLIAGAIAVQAMLVVLLAAKFKGQALGKLGFLFIAFSFVYHGLSEIVQVAFPDRNIFRSFASGDEIEWWIWLVTGAMGLFSIAYFCTARKYEQTGMLDAIRFHFEGAYLMKWPVLLAMGVSGFLFLLSRRTDSGEQGFVEGLADQFTFPLLAILLATVCLGGSQRRIFWFFAAYAVVLPAIGQRTAVFLIIAVAGSAMARYGLGLSWRSMLTLALIVAAAFGLLSLSRKTYGRFDKGESFADRLSVVFSSAMYTEVDASSTVLDDTVYRMDGNSYGAMVLARQLDGYPATGFREAVATISYMVPSFLNRDKLQSEVYLRNEESYQVYHYGLPLGTDYISVFWSVLAGYTGPWALLVLAPLIGFAFASLDNWLAQTPTVTAFLVGVNVSLFVLNPESGVAGLLGMARGLLVFVIAAKILNRYSGGRKTLNDTPFTLSPTSLG